VVTPNRSMDWAKSLAHHEDREHDQRGEYESRRWPEGVYGASHDQGVEINAGKGKNPHRSLPQKGEGRERGRRA
jgi:hypothetical protein